jgi:hypothetical protein
MNVDGFNATQAAAAYPPLAQMQMEQFALSNLGVIQSLIPTRIQGQLFTHHPQLLEVDMQVSLHMHSMQYAQLPMQSCLSGEASLLSHPRRCINYQMHHACCLPAITHHAPLVCAMQAWVDFLQSFGLQEQQIADLLRSSPELFYSSNIFQVRTPQPGLQQQLASCVQLR